MKRFLSVLLVFCLLITVFSGCEQQPEVPANSSVAELPERKVEHREFDKVFDFVLTREVIDEFLECVEQTTETVISSTDEDYIDEWLTEMDNFYIYIVDQKAIANLLYCQDLTDETLRQQYLTAVDYETEASEAYNQSALEIYTSGTEEVKKVAFEGWSEAELERLGMYTENVVALEKANEELVVAYRDLPDNRFEDGVAPLYKDMVDNLNQIARIYEYDNYYTYAYEVVYARDYSAEEIATMRQYVAEYLAPICDDAYTAFVESYSALNSRQQELVAGLVEADYDKLSRNYVEEYLQSLPDDMKEDMLYMFEGERVIFTDEKEAQDGAFTTTVYEEPYCFFGPGYQNSMTLVHELGHFYGLTYVDLAETPLDLAETHSQSNEWLFMRYLEDVLDPLVFQALRNYRMYNDIVTVVACVLVDEFEEQVYTHEDPQSLTRGKLDQIADQVCEAYGSKPYISRYVVDLRDYWKNVTMEAPAYYISYAVSMLVSMNVYTVAQENVEEAFEIYRSLIEEADLDAGFLHNIRQAGLPSPFEESVYIELYNMYA